MILTGSAIRDNVKNRQITISPFDEKMCNPNSYNYRLGSDIYEVISTTIDPKDTPILKKIKVGKDGSMLLEPGKLYLGSTKEVIGSQIYMTSLIGRSSVGRLGLFMQITADLGQLGNSHKWTLEMTVVQPLKVYANMIIGQVTFWEVSGESEEKYIGGYSVYNRPEVYRSFVI